MSARPYKVYVATIPDGRQYVGCTGKSIEARAKAWGGSRRKPEPGSPPVGVQWFVAVMHVGLEAISVRVLSEHDRREDAHAAERAAIRDLNTRVPHGFNVASGGSGLRKARDIIDLRAVKGVWPPVHAPTQQAAA